MKLVNTLTLFSMLAFGTACSHYGKHHHHCCKTAECKADKSCCENKCGKCTGEKGACKDGKKEDKKA